ncbi:hypothetical protein [Streptomyces sp. MUM 16J]|uniref:hypothetical protein n=1 Tax=Streptomyces sp. MUM 16J TaxID=2791988 RepID=UPI001F047FCD|nr:hypothetical protein [Streptomyces sp. MUM 16J]MCH0555988.1 hypothetical protein [Streptomyces sp. MUM 16J]
MHMFLVVGVAVTFGLLAVCGVAGIATGWVVPWGRSRVLRPTLWGYSCLTCAVSGATWIYLGPLAGSYGPLPWIGWIAFMAGLYLGMLSQRPGRSGARKTTS